MTFPLDYLGTGFNSMSPWRRRRTKIYKKVNKKKKDTFKIIKTKKQAFK